MSQDMKIRRRETGDGQENVTITLGGDHPCPIAQSPDGFYQTKDAGRYDGHPFMLNVPAGAVTLHAHVDGTVRALLHISRHTLEALPDLLTVMAEEVESDDLLQQEYEYQARCAYLDEQDAKKAEEDAWQAEVY